MEMDEIVMAPFDLVFGYFEWVFDHPWRLLRIALLPTVFVAVCLLMLPGMVWIILVGLMMIVRDCWQGDVSEDS